METCQHELYCTLMHHESSLKVEKAFSPALISPAIIVRFTEEKATAWFGNSLITVVRSHTQTCTLYLKFCSFYVRIYVCVCVRVHCIKSIL